MADLVTAYVEEIRRGIEHDMSPADVESVIVETEAHLRERIAALVELGNPEDAAAREAITTFGPVHGYVREIVEASEPSKQTLNRSMVHLAIAASVLAVAAPFIAIANSNTYLFALPLAPCLGLFAVSLRSRRAIPLHMGAVALGTYFAFIFVFSVTMLPFRPFGGNGIMPVWDVDMVRQAETENLVGTQAAKDLRDKRTRLLTAADPLATAKELGLVKGNQLIAPTGSVTFAPSLVAQYQSMSPAEGIVHWKQQGPQAIRVLNDVGSSAVETLAALDRAQRASYWERLMGSVSECHPLGGIWLVILVQLNALGAWIGCIRQKYRGFRLRIRFARD